MISNADASARFDVDTSGYIGKTGKLEDNTIIWTITVNDKKHDIGGFTLSDKTWNDGSNGSSQSVAFTRDMFSPNTGFQINSDGTVTFDANNTTTYTITYKVDVSKVDKTTNYWNKANIKSAELNIDSSTPTVTVERNELIQKSGEADKENHTAHYEVKINESKMDIGGIDVIDSLKLQYKVSAGTKEMDYDAQLKNG